MPSSQSFHLDIIWEIDCKNMSFSQHFVVLTTTFLPNKHMVFTVIHSVRFRCHWMLWLTWLTFGDYLPCQWITHTHTHHIPSSFFREFLILLKTIGALPIFKSSSVFIHFFILMKIGKISLTYYLIWWFIFRPSKFSIYWQYCRRKAFAL